MDQEHPAVEYPYIRNIYKLYRKENLVENVHLPDEGHDYGSNKRLAAYSFLAKHLNLDLNKVKSTAGRIEENFVTVEDKQKLRVWDANHAEPAYAIKEKEAINKMLQSYSMNPRK